MTAICYVLSAVYALACAGLFVAWARADRRCTRAERERDRAEARADRYRQQLHRHRLAQADPSPSPRGLPA